MAHQHRVGGRCGGPVMLVYALLALPGAGIAGIASADVRYVDDDAPPGGDGLTWETAFAHVADAIAAADGDPSITEIRLAGGTYRPDTSAAVPGGTGDREAVLDVPPGIALRGGFAGPGAADPDVQSFDEHPSTITGDLAGDDDPEDPATRGDNSRTLLRVLGGPNDITLIQGLVARGAEDAGMIGDPRVGAFDLKNGSVTVTDCTFLDNRVTRLDQDEDDGRGNYIPASEGGGIGATDVTLLVERSVFRGNRAFRGGALWAVGGSVTIVDSTFRRNDARRAASGGNDGVGGAIRIRDAASAVLRDTLIDDNSAGVSGGASFIGVASVRLERVTFRDNVVPGGAGALGIGDPAEVEIVACVLEGNSALSIAGMFVLGSSVDMTEVSIRDSIFRLNASTTIGGAVGIGGATIEVVNCLFDRNAGLEGGGLNTASSAGLVTHCTFFANDGTAADFGPDVEVRNCILWANVPTMLSGGEVRDSLVQPGAGGAGNFSADPSFVQPGSGDLRLAFGSPAIDAANPRFLPPDVELDLAGQPRVQGPLPDLGPYEGGYEPLPPADVYPDVDPGEPVVAGLDGGDFQPLEGPSMIFVNESDVEDATLTVAAVDAASLPPGPGADLVGTARVIETEVPDGGMRLLLLLPFDAADLEAAGGPGADPLRMDLVCRDEATGAWALAAAANAVPSPGWPTPLADRTVQVDAPAVAFSSAFGRWGVWWSSAEQRGVVWGTADRAGTYAIGYRGCPADAAQPPDGLVATGDLLAVLTSWGRGAGPWDVDGDGLVGTDDVTAVLAAWGTCD